MEPAARTVVAVTGATGFVGQWILRHLTEAGYQVRALTRRAQSSETVTWIPGSLEDLRTQPRPETVLRRNRCHRPPQRAP